MQPLFICKKNCRRPISCDSLSASSEYYRKIKHLSQQFSKYHRTKYNTLNLECIASILFNGNNTRVSSFQLLSFAGEWKINFKNHNSL